MRYVLASAAIFLFSSSAYATPTVPAPEADFGIAAIAMVAGAALLARRLRG